jgi:hypothetical protein
VRRWVHSLVLAARKSGHIMVRTHVRKNAQNLNNSGGMSGALDFFAKCKEVLQNDIAVIKQHQKLSAES